MKENKVIKQRFNKAYQSKEKSCRVGKEESKKVIKKAVSRQSSKQYLRSKYISRKGRDHASNQTSKLERK